MQGHGMHDNQEMQLDLFDPYPAFTRWRDGLDW